MSSRPNIAIQHERQLWARSAGRCEYEGCNRVLFRAVSTTQGPMNGGHKAHIIGASKDGPRGGSESERLAADIDNLMLLCLECHRRVDKEEVEAHPPERLRAMKRTHEERIERAAEITPDMASEIVLFGVNVGPNHPQLTYEQARVALLPERLPARSRATELSLTNCDLRDDDPAYWEHHAQRLERVFARHLQPDLDERSHGHLSVFGLAPQPLLMKLGTLLSDIPAADVYQLHREPPTWAWPEVGTSTLEVQLNPPAQPVGPPALVLGLSATVSDERVRAVLPDAAIWRLDVEKPSRDLVRRRDDLRVLRETFRHVLDKIKAAHGEQALLHVFPAVPLSAAIEFGRVHQPKADLALLVYDQNASRGGFMRTLMLGSVREDGGQVDV